MHKSKIDGWICRLAQGISQYRINNVNFVVDSRFEPVDSETTIKDRFNRTITSDFIPLTEKTEPCKMEAEYVARLPERSTNAVEK